MNKTKNIIIVSAHPDDEVLGAGGTLIKHKNNNDKITWIIATDINIKAGYSSDQINSRKKEVEQIKKEIGISKVYNLGYSTTSLSSSSVNEMVPVVSEIFKITKPEIIYVVNRSDAHSDHRHLFNAVFSCTKFFRHNYIKKILMYECISETEFAPALPENQFIPNYFVDISNEIENKIKLIEIYKSEIGLHPFPRSIENIKALAKYRGAMIGVNYAESFHALRIIKK